MNDFRVGTPTLESETHLRPAWVQDAIFYEIFPDRFRNGDPGNDPSGSEPWGSPPTRENFTGGDLAGIRAGLPYLANLGVNAIYLTPIFEAATNHRYDARDYLRIDPALGELGSFREFVSEAHQHGIRVILDGVFNHCGDDFWAFRDLIAHGADSPYRSWFFPRGFPIVQSPPNYQTCGGAQYLPKLNTANPDVRRYLLDVARFWIEAANIDGWRLDVPWKADAEFWAEFRAAVKAVKPDAYLVGEIWRDGQPWLDEFDGVMNYRLRDALIDFCARDAMDAEDVAYEIGHLLSVHGDASPWMMNLLGSHDTPRLLTLCGGDTRRAVLALTMLFTLPGAPLLYYGDEIGLEGDNDPDCRRCMDWDEAHWNQEIVTACRRLTDIRQQHVALRAGSWEPLLTFNGVLAYRRRAGNDDVMIIVNPRNAQCDFEIPIPGVDDGLWNDPIHDAVHPVVNGRICIANLPEKSALILTTASAR